MKPLRRYSGFSLIEMVIAITITGIVAAMVASFIRYPVESYVASVRRAELTDQADVALRRIARDVRLALPNSLRVASDGSAGFEFILTKSGGRYRDPADGSTGGDFLSFTTAADTTFHVLGTSPANPPNIATGDSMVIYNLGSAPANAYTGGNITTVTVTAGTPYTLTMGTQVYATQSPPLPSPTGRFQIVDAADLVVRYTCTGNVLTRFAGCSIATPSVCPAGNVLAGDANTTVACNIDTTTAAVGRNGLLYVNLTLTDVSSSERITLFNEIHVDNSP